MDQKLEYEVHVANPTEPPAGILLRGNTADLVHLVMIGHLVDRLEACYQGTRLLGFISRHEQATLSQALDDRRRKLLLTLARDAAVASVPREQTREYELEQRYTTLKDAIEDHLGDYVDDGEEAEEYLLVNGIRNAADDLRQFEQTAQQERGQRKELEARNIELTAQVTDARTLAMQGGVLCLTNYQRSQLQNTRAMLKEVLTIRPLSPHLNCDIEATLTQVQELVKSALGTFTAVYGSAL